ncbi:FMN-binding negative transcriptional regulator [Cytobacillus praedii]|nr:FMN-binding negative transcriptional regulator [Cytobacillus praedii]
MYIPKYFKVTDMDEVNKFIQTYSFGTFVTTPAAFFTLQASI